MFAERFCVIRTRRALIGRDDWIECAELYLLNGNGKSVFSKELTFTDFPLDEITLWFANNVIYLPSEH